MAKKNYICFKLTLILIYSVAVISGHFTSDFLVSAIKNFFFTNLPPDFMLDHYEKVIIIWNLSRGFFDVSVIAAFWCTAAFAVKQYYKTPQVKKFFGLDTNTN